MTNIDALNEMLRDLVDVEFVFDVAKENKIAEFLNTDISVEFNRYIKDFANSGLIKVKVNKGRKWKGEGYIIGSFESAFNTGYRNIYTTYVKIYDPSTNKIETIAFKNVTDIDYSALIKIYKDNIVDILNKFNVNETNRLHIINPLTVHLLNILNFDVLKEIEIELNNKIGNILNWIYNNTGLLNKDINLENAIDELENAKKAKNEAFKAKKMPELIEWVKNNTDKKGEEINELAERIFNKKYGKY